MNKLRIVLVRRIDTGEFSTRQGLAFGPAQEAVILRSDREVKKKIQLLKRLWKELQEAHVDFPKLWKDPGPCPEFVPVVVEVEVP